MSRGTIEGLGNPHPLAGGLPGMLLADDLAVRLTEGLDEVLAPLLCVLDNLDAYFDPRLTPEDFLTWIGGWVGVVLDPDWSEEQRRAVVAGAVDVHVRAGTPGGMKAEIEAATGAEVEIEESGGVAWSATPGAALPGEPSTTVTVRVRVRHGHVDRARLEAVAAAAAPAHLTPVVEVIERADRGGASSRRAKAGADESAGPDESEPEEAPT